MGNYFSPPEIWALFSPSLPLPALHRSAKGGGSMDDDGVGKDDSLPPPSTLRTSRRRPLLGLADCDGFGAEVDF